MSSLRHSGRRRVTGSARLSIWALLVRRHDWDDSSDGKELKP
jgi:hypothetical protein